MWGTQGVFQGAQASSQPTLNSFSSSQGGGLTGAQMGKVATSGLSSIGGFMEQRGLASALDDQAGLTDLSAESIMQAGRFRAEDVRARGNRFIATQRAKYAKAGVKFEGSPAMVFAQTEKNIAKDVIFTRLNAAKQASQQRYAALRQRLAAGRARTQSYQELGKGVLNMGMTYASMTA